MKRTVWDPMRGPVDVEVPDRPLTDAEKIQELETRVQELEDIVARIRSDIRSLNSQVYQ